MTEAAPNIGVDAVFHKLLNARNEPHVSALQAKEIVARRDRLLSIYTQEGIPSELKEYFAGAIKITDLCDQYAMTIVTLLSSPLALESMPASDIIIRARLYLDAAMALNGTVDPQSAKEHAKLRDRVVLALTTASNDPLRAHENVDEIINIELADLNDLEQSSAKLEAILIMTQVKRMERNIRFLAV